MVSEKRLPEECRRRGEWSAPASQARRWIGAALLVLLALSGRGPAQTTLRTPDADDPQCGENGCPATPRAAEGNANPNNGQGGIQRRKHRFPRTRLRTPPGPAAGTRTTIRVSTISILMRGKTGTRKQGGARSGVSLRIRTRCRNRHPPNFKNLWPVRSAADCQSMDTVFSTASPPPSLPPTAFPLPTIT